MDRRDFLTNSSLALGALVSGSAVAHAGGIMSASTVAAAASAAAGESAPGSAVQPIERLASLNDLEPMAKEAMSASVLAHVAYGAGNQWTHHQNFRSIENFQIRPAYLSGNSKPDLRTKLLGSDLKLPLYSCPMGSHGIVHTTAEEGTSKGTGAAGALMMLSTAANRTVEQVAAVNPGPK